MKKNPEATPEVTGFDADPSEAAVGSAGNGASLHGADLSGAVRDFEDAPHAEDILPDQVVAGPEAPEEEAEVTARPSERPGPVDEPAEHAASEDDDRPALSAPADELA